MGSRSEPRPGARSAAAAAALAVAGCLGAWPRAGGSDPVALLVWLAVLAVPAGFLGARAGLRAHLEGLAVCALWLAAALAAGAGAPRSLPQPLLAGLAWSGLYLAGHGLGRLAPPGLGAWRGAGALLLAAGLLVHLPGRGGGAQTSWPAGLARTLLALSPATLLAECAGIDWMRHPGVYDPVASDRFERAPRRGALAAPAALLVGCLLAGAGALRSRGERHPRGSAAGEARP